MSIRCVVASAFLAAVLACGCAASARASIVVVVDKSAQQMTVNVDGQLRWTWPVSTGTPRYDTPNGQYTAFRMEAKHFSKEWDDAPMPHSIFFTMKGHAIHGSLHTKLGQPASHGCVRLAPENAAALYALVEQQGLPNTKVVIEGEVPQAPVVARTAPSAGARPPRLATSQTQPREPQTMRERPTVRERRVTREQRAYRAAPQAYAAPVYPAPQPYSRPAYRAGPFFAPQPYSPPQAATAPPAQAARRTYAAPRIPTAGRVYYDPRVEVTEETYVNGVKIRRHYTRRALPSDWR